VGVVLQVVEMEQMVLLLLVVKAVEEVLAFKLVEQEDFLVVGVAADQQIELVVMAAVVV
jgi:hypothetical protein